MRKSKRSVPKNQTQSTQVNQLVARAAIIKFPIVVPRFRTPPPLNVGGGFRSKPNLPFEGGGALNEETA